MEVFHFNGILIKGKIMTVIREKIRCLGVVASVLLLSFYCFSGNTFAQAGSSITIDDNLKPGMPLKDAVELLGPPEKVKISDIGTVIMSYDSIGLSIEVLNDGAIVEAIHLQSGFKGRFASGITIGDDTQKIITSYNQPDTQTNDVIEYSMPARRFLITQDKLAGADLYKDKSALYHQIPVKVVKRFEEKVIEANKEKVAESSAEKVAEQKLENEDDYYSEKKDDEAEEPEINVFELYGFKVKQESGQVIITEVTPGSFAEEGGLKVGEPIRKVVYKGGDERNIYAVSGLKSVLKRAIEKRKKIVNILQSKNYYFKVKVPRLYKKL
jgi:hypothetical protein